MTILGGGHGDPFIGPIDQPETSITAATTLAFFDRYLRGDPEALDRLKRSATIAGARFERRG